MTATHKPDHLPPELQLFWPERRPPSSDRLGAVIRGRDLGLLHVDDLSRQFQWNVRTDYHAHDADGDSSGNLQ